MSSPNSQERQTEALGLLHYTRKDEVPCLKAGRQQERKSSVLGGCMVSRRAGG